jgi:hypothetical protein
MLGDGVGRASARGSPFGGAFPWLVSSSRRNEWNAASA